MTHFTGDTIHIPCKQSSLHTAVPIASPEPNITCTETESSTLSQQMHFWFHVLLKHMVAPSATRNLRRTPYLKQHLQYVQGRHGVAGCTRATMKNVKFVNCCLVVTDGASVTLERSHFKMQKDSVVGLSLYLGGVDSSATLTNCTIAGACQGMNSHFPPG